MDPKTEAATAEAAPAKPVAVAIRDKTDARSRLLKTRQASFKIVEFEGCLYSVVSPSAGVRDSIYSKTTETTFKAGVVGGDVKTTPKYNLLRALCIVHMVHTVTPAADGAAPNAPDGKAYIPGGKVFEAADVDALMGSPADVGSMFRDLGDVCADVYNDTISGADASRAEAKNG